MERGGKGPIHFSRILIARCAAVIRFPAPFWVLPVPSSTPCARLMRQGRSALAGQTVRGDGGRM